MKLSIVIPAYNVAKYIDKCLSSLLDQDLPRDEYEIIVINDGSTDDTLSVVRDVATRHSNIRVFDKQNGGMSMARNDGIGCSTGEYIMFVDSDDYIEANCLATIYTKMKSENLDIVEFGFKDVDEYGNQVANRFPFTPSRDEKVVTSGRESMLQSKVLYPMVWCRAYRRSFFTENNLIMYPIRHEDEEFIPRALYLAKRVSYLSNDYYKYVCHDGSTMGAYKESSFFDMITAMGNLHHFATTAIDQQDKAMLNFVNDRIATILLMIFKRSIRDGYKFQDRMVERMSQLSLYPLRGKHKSIYVLFFNLSYKFFVSYYKLKLRLRGEYKYCIITIGASLQVYF